MKLQNVGLLDKISIYDEKWVYIYNLTDQERNKNRARRAKNRTTAMGNGSIHLPNMCAGIKKK